jgi:hypothetical protein
MDLFRRGFFRLVGAVSVPGPLPRGGVMALTSRMIVLPKPSLFILFPGFVFASSIAQAPAATSSLDNGIIQITVDLAKGGGIVGFNPSGQPANNVINTYDLGREQRGQSTIPGNFSL